MKRAQLLTIGVGAVWLVLLAAPVGRAEEPELAVEAGATEVFAGENVDYVVEVRNVKTPTAPNLSALRADFDITFLGDESRNQSSVTIINGQVSEQNSLGHAYHFRLVPKRSGSLTIAAPTLTVDGKTVSGRTLSLKVIGAEPQDLVIPEIKVSRSRIYPTQPFDVTLRVLVHPLPEDADHDPLAPLRRRPPHIKINWVDPPAGLTGEDKTRWLQGRLAEDGVGFTVNDFTVRSMSIFGGSPAAVFNLSQGRESRKGIDGRPVNYFVYELKRTLTTAKAGTYDLGPGFVTGIFVSGSAGTRYTSRRLVAVTPAVRVVARDVPSPRPSTYCGGIGNYRLAAAATPTTLRVGDPLTLTLEIERQPGSGSLDLISAPELSANAQMAADFEIVDRSPTGRTEGDVKRFDYALRPKREGISVPALAVSVFDPDHEKFSEIASKPIPLTVSAASRVGAGDLVGTLGSSGTPQIQSRAQGIFQNVTDPSQLTDQRVSVAALAGVAAGSWLAAGCVIALVGVYRRKSGDLVWQRKRSARRTAERKLDEARTALAAGRTREAIAAVRSSLIGLIADTRNIVAEGLTASEAGAALDQTSVSAEDRQGTLRLLESIESAEYGSASGTEIPALIDTADALVPRLARQLERSS